jgi:hypothetical protein
MKRLDPYHIMYSPITGRTLGQAWRYQAASGKRNGQPAQLTKRPAQLTKRDRFLSGPARGGAPAFDVFTFEHYELPVVGGGVTTARQLQQYPLDWAPCWAMGEASGQRDGNFPAESPAQLRVQDWLAFVGGGVRGQLWFDLSYSVNEQIIEAASDVGTKLATLAGGILSSAAAASRLPLVASNADGVLARAFESAQGELYVVAVNERLAPVANISLSVVSADGASSLLASQGCRVTAPFEESRTLAMAAPRHLITEPLGAYEARVYRIETITSRSVVGQASGNLVVNPQWTAQTLPGTPDHWLLFPVAGTPAGGMDLEAVLLVDPAAARHDSNTTVALRAVVSEALGTGIHLPLALDHVGLSAHSSYNLSFWARTSVVATAGVLVLAASPRAWHYGDSSPALLSPLASFMLHPAWQHYTVVITRTNGTLNLLPKEAGTLWLSEVCVTELAPHQ